MNKNFFKSKFFLIIFLLKLNDVLSQLNTEPDCVFGQNCRLPYCSCVSNDPPVRLNKFFRKDKIPQLVILTIDDDKLDIKSYQVYKKLFESFNNTNKNCSIRATFFVSDSNNETSYCLIRNLYDMKHEIAISTINYTCPHKRCTASRSFRPWSYLTWTEQIIGMRDRVSKYSAIPIPDINGFRAPIIEPASDLHYRIIFGNRFLYDSSISTMNDNMFSWPFTIDYVIKTDLNNNGPIEKYPGLWELPLPSYTDLDNERLSCTKIWENHCQIDRTVYGTAKFLRHHFLRAYYNNRAPLVLHFNGDWLKEPTIITEYELLPNVGFSNIQKRKIKHERKEYRNLDGVIKFINDTLTNNKEVYFVTAQQAIEFMQNMARLEKEPFNLTKYIEDELLKCHEEKYEYNAQCPDLKIQDYDTEESLYLDDEEGNELKNRNKIIINSEVLLDLQTEVLFVNRVIVYFLVFTILTLISVLIYDKIY